MTSPLTITLPAEAAELVRQKVRSGVYASEADVIAESLQAFQDHDAGLEKWLREEVLPGHAEYLADPSRAILADDLLDRIRERRPDRI